MYYRVSDTYSRTILVPISTNQATTSAIFHIHIIYFIFESFKERIPRQKQFFKELSYKNLITIYC